MRCDAMKSDTLPKCGKTGKNWELYNIILDCNYIL